MRSFHNVMKTAASHLSQHSLSMKTPRTVTYPIAKEGFLKKTFLLHLGCTLNLNVNKHGPVYLITTPHK